MRWGVSVYAFREAGFPARHSVNAHSLYPTLTAAAHMPHTTRNDRLYETPFGPTD